MKTLDCPLSVGDKFYYNSFSVRNKLSLPDYLIVTKIKPMDEDGRYWIHAVYENRAIDTHERVFSDIITKEPDWIFERKVIVKGELIHDQG